MPSGPPDSERPYDEAFLDDGSPRPHYRDLIEALRGTDLSELVSSVKARLRERGVTFGASPDGYFALDPVPRILTEPEWSEIATGLAQRLRALDSFAADVYGAGSAVAEGVVPREVVETSPHFEPAMRGARPGRWVSILGIDVARGLDGRFRVIEDQVRMPSGLAYAVEARSAMAGLLPVEAPPDRLADGYAELARALRAAATPGAGEPTVVSLSEGPDSAAWWEHEHIANAVGAPSVSLDELEPRGDALLARGRPVDVVYQRTAEDRFTDTNGRPTALGEALLGPCSRSLVACVNAPGSGVTDDKLVHSYVDDLIRFHLGEEPLLPSLRSYDLSQEADREEALERLDELVIKPRGEMGGDDVVIWRDASTELQQRVRRRLAEEPAGLVAQELIELSVHPTVIDGSLEPRRVDLRPYAILSDTGVYVLPGGLSRVALEEGSMVVNSGQGGGAKDVWV